MWKNKNFYLTILVVIFMVVFSFNTKKYSQITLDGITLWALNVLPSVFFYFILTAILTSLGYVAVMARKTHPLTKRLFGTSGLSGYALIMSILSGYPTGSKITAELYEKRLISYDDAIKMSAFCTTSSPLFIVGTIGAIIGDKKISILILIAHLTSVFLSGILLKGKTTKNSLQFFKPEKVDNIIYNAVYDSIISLLVLGGIITAYYVLTEMLFDMKILSLFEKPFTLLLNSNTTAKAFICGIFESIKGIKLLSMSNHALRVPLIGFTISFGGLSVITQSAIFLKRAKIKIARFVFAKFLQAILSFIILLIFYYLKLF